MLRVGKVKSEKITQKKLQMRERKKGEIFYTEIMLAEIFSLCIIAVSGITF